MSDVARPTTILLVDDIESNRYIVSTYLTRAGYKVIQAASGAEALIAAREGNIDLAVLDVNLPDMTGYEVCERIKEMGAAVPVLHLSATAIEISDRSEGLRRGADAYLTEPVDRQELLATVEALLRRATSQRLTLDFARRLRWLNERTLDLHAAPTVHRLLESVAAGAADVTSCFAIGISLPDLVMVRAWAGAQPISETMTPDLAAQMAPPAGRDEVLRQVLDTVAAPSKHIRTYELESDAGLGSFLLVAGDPPEQAEATELLVHQLVQAATTALKNLRNYQAKNSIALTLQRALLPGRLPAVAGLEIAARYEASAEQAEVGGDFYDVFALGNDRYTLAIGDVVGHSVQAATAMAQLRTAVRAYALEGHPPASNLQKLNSLLLRFHPEMTATICLLGFDSRTGIVEVSNAGHLPPLLVDDDRPRYVEASGTMLGVDELKVGTTQLQFQPAQVLVLVTDGLVERRDESIEIGLARLASSCAHPDTPLDDLCDKILREVGPHTGPHDDIALLAIRRT